MAYKEIPFQTISDNERCPMDLYVRIKDDYRLFAAQGATFTAEHYRQFGKGGVKLYILDHDLAKAEEYLDNQLAVVLTDPQVSRSAKADIMYATSMKSVRDVFQGTSLKTIKELEKISKNIVKLILSDGQVIDDLISISSHDHYTYKHSVKVGIFGTALSINLFQDRINDHNLAELSTAFFLHDIGMARVPARILDKQGELTPNEWDVVRKHPLWGHDRLVKAKYLSDEATDIVLYHHERCDKQGYPFRKGGSDIPVYARICAIADTFEALTSDRPFRPARTPFEALRIMQTEMAGEFDPDLFRAFIMLLGPDAR
ncbi:MAG TPA: HD-GYP domain-containing protein [Deltaproteobacteria bacterium]|nr:HD-GYP domain-containing protein [Deltaproteobacteria bacterium]HOI06226.1 HD-GYP domain-containing protein [Deltaproteobacteria bacterium]